MIITLLVHMVGEGGPYGQSLPVEFREGSDQMPKDCVIILIPDIMVVPDASGTALRIAFAMSKLEWAKLLEAGRAFLIEPVKEDSQ